ncbi:MAG: hypothetical protein JW829_20275 [Pirellulales bacterium]|nr:hypothetical protein [Pirellulales bacterium]
MKTKPSSDLQFGLLCLPEHGPISVLVLALSWLLVVGCSGGRVQSPKVPSERQLATFLDKSVRAASHTAHANSVIVTTKITSYTQLRGKVLVEFEVEEQILNALYRQISLDEALRDKGWDPAAYERARERVDELPAHERTKLVEIQPTVKVPPRLYKTLFSKDEHYTWTGTCLATQTDDGGWSFSSPNPPHELYGSVMTRQKLPESALLVDSEQGQRLIVSIVDHQREYADSVESTYRRIENVLVSEKESLMSATSPGRVWLGDLHSSAGLVKVRVTFVEQDPENRTVLALVEDKEDPFQRFVYEGALKTVRNERSASQNRANGNRERWVIALATSSSQSYYSHHLRRLIGLHQPIELYAAEDGRLQAVANSDSAMWSPESTSASVALFGDRLAASLLKAVVPGSQWSGTRTVQSSRSEPSGPSTRVTYVFLEHNASDNSLQALSRTTPGDEWSVSGHEGHLIQNGKERYAWPIAFTSEAKFALLPDGTLIGVDDKARIRLEREEPLSPVPNLVQLARSAVASATAWEGMLIRENSGDEKVVLTFAEVRDEGVYVRAMLERVSDPFSVETLIGGLRLDNQNRNAYSISLRSAPASRPRSTRSPSQLAQSVQFRVALDGRTLYGRTSSQARLMLTKRESPTTYADLTASGFAEVIRARLATGAAYKGVMLPSSSRARVPVTLTVVQQNKDALTLAVQISSPKYPDEAPLRLDGTLRQDDHINAFAVQLRRSSTNPVRPFGSTKGNVIDDLQLRISPCGTLIYGTTQRADRFVFVGNRTPFPETIIGERLTDAERDAHALLKQAVPEMEKIAAATRALEQTIGRSRSHNTGRLCQDVRDIEISIRKLRSLSKKSDGELSAKIQKFCVSVNKMLNLIDDISRKMKAGQSVSENIAEIRKIAGEHILPVYARHKEQFELLDNRILTVGG